jgi:hypothetical protein
MNRLLEQSLRASRHIAVWVIWQSVGVSLVHERE